MTSLPLTTKQNWVDKIAQFLRAAFGKKALTREQIISLKAKSEVDYLLTTKIYKEDLTSSEIAFFAEEFRKEVIVRLKQRKANHIENLRIATEYHNHEIAEADKAAQSLKV